MQEQEVDVLFLDINIPSLDGMMLAHHIGKFARKPYIVFTTAYKEHAAEAFELEAFDYILKPYDEKRIAAMLQAGTTFKRDQEQRENLRGGLYGEQTYQGSPSHPSAHGHEVEQAYASGQAQFRSGTQQEQPEANQRAVSSNAAGRTT